MAEQQEARVGETTAAPTTSPPRRSKILALKTLGNPFQAPGTAATRDRAMRAKAVPYGLW